MFYYIILSIINHIQTKKGVKSMMKGFMGLILDISTFSERYRRNMSTCRYTQTLCVILQTGKTNNNE